VLQVEQLLSAAELSVGGVKGRLKLMNNNENFMMKCARKQFGLIPEPTQLLR
jgi:hypothetical protein